MINLPPTSIKHGFVSTKEVKNSTKEYIFNQDGEIVDNYFFTHHGSLSCSQYNFFEFILNSDGSMWEDANLFLLSKVQSNPEFSQSSIARYKSSLTHFKEFVDKKGIVYNDSSEWGYDNTAVHKYRNYLIDINKTPAESAKAMGVITAFYTWMIEDNGFTSDYPLWQVKILRIEGDKTVISKDVCQFKGRKNIKGDRRRYVYDGERLRPLDDDELDCILKVLDEYGNIEYKLIFYLAGETFARKQTLLTLRLWHILEAIEGNEIYGLPKSSNRKDIDNWLKKIKWPEDTDEIALQVGEGYDADTKKGRYESYPIYIHGWLWKRLIIYIVSERAFERREKAPSQQSELRQYLFLSQNGNALYHAKSDLYYNKISEIGLKKLAKGNTLDKFIDRTLKKLLAEKGRSFEFHFHCMRATGAALYLKAKREENGEYKHESNWLSALEDLSERMNHSSLETTRGYLNYLKLMYALPITQEKIENMFMGFVQKYENISAQK